MADETIEQKAQKMGHIPREQYRGDPDKYISAEDFVTRGETLLPILKARDKKLSMELSTVKGQNQALTTQLAQAMEGIEELKKFNAQVVIDRLKTQKQRLLTAVKAAKQADDTDSETELEDQLRTVNESLKEAEKVATTPKGTTSSPGGRPDPTRDPTFVQWLADNPWYNKDLRRTGFANGVSDELRSDPANAGLKGREFLDKVAEEVDKHFNSNSGRQAPSKVGGGNGRSGSGGGDGGGGGSGGRGYADLPPEARAACDKQSQNPRMVGEGKVFKTTKEFREHYIKQYDWS